MAKPNLTEVYEALRVAEAEGRTDDVAKLINYIESVEAAPDVVAEETYDPRELVSPVIPAGAGAAAGAVVPKVIESGVNAMEAGRGPKGALSKAPISINGVPEGHTPYNPRGRSVEGSVQNWRSYNDAQLEAAKKVRQESAMHKKYPGFTRAGTNPVLAPLPKNAAPIERIAAHVLPGGVSDISNFAKGVYDYKLPFIGSVGSLLGRSLVGAGAGYEAADAYNRAKMGDTTGSVISGIGSTGTALSLLPHPAAKVLGTGAGLSAQAINAYRDAMREGRIEHGAPEDYDNINPAGDTYAQGGLVHLAGGGKPIPNPEDVQGIFSYAPGYYAEVADNIVPEGKLAGPNDAARHMLAAADLTRRIGKVPLVGKHIAGPVVKGLGYGHEIENYIRGKFGDRPQSKEDMEQDLHNNALGIELGRNAGSFQDIVNKIPGAVNVRPYRKEPGKAYIRNPQEVGTPYKPFGAFAGGGPVQHFQAGRIVKAAQELMLPAAENAARTQIIGTLPTYGKAADIFAQRGATGQALDFGAGLGKGAKLLGRGTHTYEPFPQGWNPTYTNAKDIPSDAYGRLTNLNVLNVVPRDVRDEMVLDIGRTMEPGGSGIITTRGADVMNAKGRPGPEPTSIITSRDTYQKGFTKQELEDYLRYMLGQGYDINKLNLGPAGAYIQKKADGGLACLAEGGQPPKSDANEGAAFIGYPHINKNRKIGSGTGFLDALVGAPPSRENILNPSDYSYMEGYEKGEPYGIAGMVAPFAGMAAPFIKSAVKPVAKEAANRIFMGESLLPKSMRSFVPEMQPAGIIKNEKGGNWMPGNIRPGEHWTPEDQLAETLGFRKKDPALENWVNTQLTRYVKNDMGTPGDPIRALADQGILHYKPRPAYSAHNNQPTNLQREAELKRTYADTPEGESALTSLGKDWETNVDAGIKTKTIGPKTAEAYGEHYPWLKNAVGKKLHSIDDEFLYSHLGFDHIVDVLQEQLASGALRPESMKSLSVPQAVQRVHEYNLAREKAMQKVQLQAQSEMPVTKEYPEQGYKWLELKHPTDPSVTEKALKYEGDAMGHCVGGYCSDVEAGSTKIYSLRDAKGEPHVTIEVKPGKHPIGYGVSGDEDFPKSFRYEDADMNEVAFPQEQYDAIYNRAKEIFYSKQNVNKRDLPDVRYNAFQQAANEVLGELPSKIQQIKGKQNAAVKDEYKPFVQDFVRSGKWEEVRDYQNAGLKNMDMTGSNWELTNVPEDIAKIRNTERYWAVQEAVKNNDIPKYATEEEVADAIRKYARKHSEGGPVGYADGGTVQAFGGAYPGALTLGGSMTPVAPEYKTGAAPVTTATGDSTFNNTNLGMPNIVSPAMGIDKNGVSTPAPIQVWNERTGQYQSQTDTTPGVMPGPIGGLGGLLAGENPTATYKDANSPASQGKVWSETTGQWVTPGPNSGAMPSPEPYMPIMGGMTLPVNNPTGGLSSLVTPPIPQNSGTAQPFIMQPAANVPMPPNSPVAAATPSPSVQNIPKYVPPPKTFNQFGTAINQVRQARPATPQVQPTKRKFMVPPLANLRRR
jgi:hypothetical protein